MKVYSRDYQAAPLRKLAVVEQAVTDGSFMPDETRSGRFKRKAEVLDAGEAESGDDATKLYIFSKLYGKLHRRDKGKSRSVCGRAEMEKKWFALYKDFPRDVLVNTLCGNCFPGRTVESVKGE